MKFKIGLTVTCIAALSLISSMAGAQQGYVIPSQGQYHDAISAVNQLLEEDFPVYQLTDNLQVGGQTFTVGDYILPLSATSDPLFNDIMNQVAGDILDDFGLTRYALPTTFSTQASLLREPQITVYFGQGTSAGALWHIQPAVRAQFDVDIVQTADVIAGDFAGGTAITFPSGGFYAGYLGETGIANVQDFVAAGNGMLGTCGGSVFGVEAELLDVAQQQFGGFPAAGDLRGHMVLSNDAPMHPVMYPFGSTFEPHYWVGQNFEEIGAGVTVLASYVELGADVVPYDPALSRAFDYFPNTEIIETFWGKAAAVTGKYQDGKVVLTGTHPEFYVDSEPFHLNTLLHVSSEDAAALDEQSLLSIGAIREYTTVGSTSLGSIQDAVVGKLAYFLGLTFLGRSQIFGLEVENELITDAAGEFLIVFLDDQLERVPRLIGNVGTMVLQHAELSVIDLLLVLHQGQIPAGIYQTARDRVAAAKSRIVAAIQNLGNIDDHFDLAADVVSDMAQHVDDLNEILAIQASEGETPEFYTKVIDLFFAEAATRDRIHVESEYFLLKASFQADAAIENARGTKRLASAILSSI